MRGIWTVLMVMMMSGAALAAPLFFDDFTDDTPGGDPGTPVIGQPWVLDQQQYGENIRIGVLGGSNALGCARYSGQSQAPNAQAHLTAQDTADITGGAATISMRVLKQSGNLAYFSSYSGGGRGVNVHLWDDGSVVYYDGASNVTGLTYTVGAWHDLAIECDFGAQTYTIKIDGSTVAGATDVPMETATSTMEYLAIGSGKGGTVWVDDVTITPEPATALIAIAGVALLRRRRI